MTLSRLAILASLSILLLNCSQMDKKEQVNADTAALSTNHALELAYQTTVAELKLIERGGSYLVFDIPQRRLDIRLNGTTLKEIRINPVEDTSALRKFADRFAGPKGKLVRPLSGKHLFAGQDQTPDSILAIVSNVVKAEPELMQRNIPRHFRLYWDDKLILDVVSDIEAEPEDAKSRIQNTVVEARYVLRKPFGATLLVIKVEPDEALTLFRMAGKGVPTLLDMVQNEPQPMPKPKRKK